MEFLNIEEIVSRYIVCRSLLYRQLSKLRKLNKIDYRKFSNGFLYNVSDIAKLYESRIENVNYLTMKDLGAFYEIDATARIKIAQLRKNNAIRWKNVSLIKKNLYHVKDLECHLNKIGTEIYEPPKKEKPVQAIEKFKFQNRIGIKPNLLQYYQIAS